MKVIRE
jgi:hypothetical protein